MWKHKATIAVGGLQYVGYAPHTDMLLVLSSNGEGIINCLTGEKVDRLYNDEEWYGLFDEKESLMLGFSMLDDILIKMSGIDTSDFLPKRTKDGWTMVRSEKRPEPPPFEKISVTDFLLISPDGKKKYQIDNDFCGFRAFGFSDTEKSCVVATGCDVAIWYKEA